MKKLKIHIMAIVAVATTPFLSCTDLDEKVYDSITAESTRFSEEDVLNLMAPPYTSLRELYWGWWSFFDTQEESSDLIVTPVRIGLGWDDGGIYRSMHQHTWNSFSINHSVRIWERSYSGINNINRAIFQLEQIEGVENINAYIAELRGLRALFYYILLDHFRNVPIVDRFDVPVGFLPEQHHAREVFEYVEKELEEVMPLLSEDNDIITYGKFTKWAAKMVLAKIYLNAEVYIGESKWTEAIGAIDEIINSGKFRLADNYRDPFVVDNHNSVEQIFSIPCDEIYASGFHYHSKTLHPLSQKTFNLQSQPWGGSAAIPQFIDTYDNDDTRLDDTWLSGPQFSSSGEPLMLGAEQLNYVNYISRLEAAEQNEGYRFIKYEIRNGALSQLSNDVPFFRYTDALMIKAECQLRLGNSDEAAKIVSEVRKRAFEETNPAKAQVAGLDLTKGSSYQYGLYQNGSINKFEGGDDIPYGRFLDELAWEFVGEHHRRQDLIRFGVFTRKSRFEKAGNGETFRIYFPIPQTQIDVNPNLVQNEGY